MDFIQKINEDLKAAMKAKDQVKLRTVRAVKAAILLAQTDGSGQQVDEAKGLKIINKLLKQRKDSLKIYEDQGREDLAAVEREEIKVLETYLPEQLGEEEILRKLKEMIAASGASSMKDMGRVMGMASKAFAGQADNSLVAKLVKQLLGA